MKKISSLLIIAMLLISTICFSALAAKKPGDIWTIEIPISSEKPLSMVMAEYDISDGLAFVNGYGSTRMIVLEKNEMNFLGVSVGNVTSSSVMLEILVKDSATRIETVQVTNVQGIWEDDVAAIGKPVLRTVIVDLPLRGALPETEIDASETEDIPDIPDIPLPTVYPNNTMCIMGPRLRDIAPGSTDKWYMVTPVDISQDGEQVFPLVASNMYCVGAAIVAVKDGQLTVSYQTLEGVTVHSEYLAIYPDIDAAVADNAAELGGESLKFGKPISIADDLAGDTSMLLLMCNSVTYDTDVKGLCRFYYGAPDVKNLFEHMQEIIK
ncbi:MAG TPA: hypothetical protein GXZ91_01380 [Christensenellaceae bacterium]|jgi:hypothetical protein|nr:hypothetical protein [Christensenellaceae bacterium]